MRYLSSALYGEGATDDRFLCPLLARLCHACASRSSDLVEVSDVLALADLAENRGLPRDQRIAKAATAADGAWLLLFVHADADGREGSAEERRIEPARQLLMAQYGQTRQTVSVVPVRKTEAWAIADPDAIRLVFGTTLSDQELGLVDVVQRGADHLLEPERALLNALHAARPCRRQLGIAPFMAPLGGTVSLDRLRQLAAFRALEADTLAAMRQLGIVL